MKKRRGGESDAGRKAADGGPRDAAPDTEARILEAAHTVFLRVGTAGARMVDIARAAGVNHALLHYYFTSKEGLAEAVFLRAAGDFLPGILAALGSDAPLAAKVAEVAARYTDRLREQPYLAGYLVAELTYRPERVTQLLAGAAGGRLEALRTRVLSVLDAQIAARVDAGTMRPVAAEQFLISVLALTVFPFVARPLLQAVLGLDAAGFDELVMARRGEVPALVFGGLQPEPP
ncbi:TetR/AcrR family transcriptional regulator [Longimicrobium terrae]|uniref:AcrR family transcriptional regulator n=1 Tax=Longimicrobium terrae TaxID=1639882 RepID=A0A841GR34_9BACT|nr:TetR/AcrR family transcriptional regulator [Longimicrobium terrae]MBB4634421.1 AcrR family transcriptional regulator [Longimicrobium terrae]MBB6068689.1 AcrR family transcriptional regulator [Longimicrobium terrae]NNC27875.1 TetR/AcrR family transcriptional regulator [Longimicrobium terrae]